MNSSSSVYDKVVCITSNYKLAAEISSLFFDEKTYFVVLEAPSKYPDNFSSMFTDNLLTAITNQLSLIAADYVILADLDKTIEQIIVDRFPNKDPIIIVSNREEIDTKIIEKLGIELQGTIQCSFDRLAIGLVDAKRQKKRLEPNEMPINYKELIEPTLSETDAKELLCFEKQEGISDIIAANFAFAENMSLLEIPQFDRDQTTEINRRIQSIGSDANTDEQTKLAMWSDVKNQILQRFPKVFSIMKYHTACFITQGIPYSFVFDNIIPISHMYTIYLGQNIVYGYLHTRKDVIPTGHAIIFAPRKLSDDDEVDVVEKVLSDMQYKVTALCGDSATIDNFHKYVQYLPYDILHLTTHGGTLSGENIVEEYTDSKGVSHIVDYDQIVLTQNPELLSTLKPEDKVAVFVFQKFNTFDGKAGYRNPPRAIEWMERKKTSAFTEGSIISRTPKETDVAFSNAIDCINGPILARFHLIASQGSPFIFNCSCSSLYELGLGFIHNGAIGYIGTLWDVDNDVAKDVAEVVYRNLQDMPIGLALQAAQKGIINGSQRNIFAYFGSPINRIFTFSPDTYGKFYIAKVIQCYMRWKQYIKEHEYDDNYKDAIENAKEAHQFLRQTLLYEKYRSTMSNDYRSSGLYQCV